MAIFAIGLLGVASLQVASLRLNRSALYDSQAILLAQEMLERMQINLGEARAGSYDIDYASAPPADPGCYGMAADCNPGALRRHDLADWRERIQRELPAGVGMLETAVDNAVDPPIVTVTARIRWGVEGDERPEVGLSVQLPVDG
jgi:type IV pilus assembly protein PilV